MSTITGKTVLITGGASGIGLIMGRLLLEAGASELVIWDLNAKALDDVTTLLLGKGYRVSPFQVDISDTKAVLKALLNMQASNIRIDILINNAGIVFGKAFIDHSHDEIDKTLAINVGALMHLTREVLPGMIERGFGHIINISSAASMLANPNMSVYCSSKWAVTGWSDSLRLEMQERHPTVKVLTVNPYYINTGMFAGVHSSLIPILEPNLVSKKIVHAIQKNKTMLRMPWIINLLPLMSGVLPRPLFDLVVGKWFGIYNTMSSFKGRKS